MCFATSCLSGQRDPFGNVSYKELRMSGVTLVRPDGEHELSPHEIQHLDTFGIRTLSGPVASFKLHEDSITGRPRPDTGLVRFRLSCPRLLCPV